MRRGIWYTEEVRVRKGYYGRGRRGRTDSISHEVVFAAQASPKILTTKGILTGRSRPSLES